MLTKEGIERYLENKISIEVYDELESTNKTAKKAADSGIRRDALIAARSQTGGRGRMGRSFFSPEGGLYMSLIIPPCDKPSDTVKITTAAAVAVSRAIESVSDAVCQIKWVNDVYISEKKVCGILTEATMGSDGMPGCVILGIGVNLTAPYGGFPDDIKDRAGAVYEALPPDGDNRLAAEIVNKFYGIYKDGIFLCDYLKEYKSRSCVIGRTVDIIRVVGGEARCAKAAYIDDECRLIVTYGDGSSEALCSGDISIRTK